MLRLRFRTACLVVACGLSAALGTTHAIGQTTNVELAGAMGGRIIGAAKACGINAERVRRTSERLMSVLYSKATSAEESKSAKDYFVAAQSAGTEQVRSERSKCSEIHVDFAEIEIRLGRTPGLDNDAVAVKRGVPALGALKPDSAATTRKE